jgi:ATP-dependent RNA helicase DDX51/DBP6
MSSQLYSRYIPPKSSSSTRTEASTTPQLSIASHAPSPPPQPLIQQQPITRPDASWTYARYVPPKSKTTSQSGSNAREESPSLPKRKHEDAKDIQAPPTKKAKNTKSSSSVQEDAADTRTNPKEKKRKLKLKHEKDTKIVRCLF